MVTCSPLPSVGAALLQLTAGGAATERLFLTAFVPQDRFWSKVWNLLVYSFLGSRVLSSVRFLSVTLVLKSVEKEKVGKRSVLSCDTHLLEAFAKWWRKGTPTANKMGVSQQSAVHSSEEEEQSRYPSQCRLFISHVPPLHLRNANYSATAVSNSPAGLFLIY